MPVIGKKVGISVDIHGDPKDLNAALKESEKSLELFGHTVTAKGVVSVATLAGAAGFAATKIVEMTGAAAADRDEVNKLAAVYDAAGISLDEYNLASDAAIKMGAEKAFSDSEVRAGLQQLVAVTQDADEANRLLAVAMDISRLTGAKLEDVSKALALAEAGQTTQLIRLLPALKNAEEGTDLVAEASKLAAGQADLYAESSEGMGKTAKNAWAEIAETIGSVFLPILDAILPAMLPILEAFGELIEAILPILIPLIETLGRALEIVAKALSTVVGWVVQLIEKLGVLIQKVRDAIPDLGRLSDIGSGLFIAPTVASAGGATVNPFVASPNSSGGVVININGDPAVIEREVMRALRSYARRQGVDISRLT